MLGRESPMRGTESLQAHAGLAPHVVLLIGAEGEPIRTVAPTGGSLSGVSVHLLAVAAHPESDLGRQLTKSEVAMSTLKLQCLGCIGAVVCALAAATSVHAQVEVGTWLRQSEEAGSRPMTMTVERCCGTGRRLVYRIEGVPTVMTVESPFDGSEAPVLVDGKPSGETMAIKRLDDHHTYTVLKMNGKEFGTSKASLSPRWEDDHRRK